MRKCRRPRGFAILPRRSARLIEGATMAACSEASETGGMNPPPDPHYRPGSPPGLSATLSGCITCSASACGMLSCSWLSAALSSPTRRCDAAERKCWIGVQEIRCEFRRPRAPPPAATRGQVVHGRCVTNTTLERRCGAVREMRVGPSTPAVRCRRQTTASCCC
jgi:hypothetical protein